MKAALAQTELQSDIGTTYLYSNFGFMWLSKMLSRVGSASPSSTATIATGKVVPHWDTAAALAGVGGLRSSIADMACFAGAVAGRRGTPLKAAIELAVKPDRTGGGSMVGLAWHLANAWNGRAIATRIARPWFW